MTSQTDDQASEVRAFTEQYNELVERTLTLPNIQAQLDAIDALEEALDPRSEAPEFIVATSSLGY